METAALRLDEGAVLLDIWTFTSWCQQVGRLNVIRTNLLTANALDRVQAMFNDAFGVKERQYALAA